MTIRILLILLISVKCSGQFFRSYNVRQGLPSSRILDIAQDEKGLIWLATNNGLSRFDGYQFTNFSNQENDSTSLSGDYISSLEVGIDHTLWVGHYEGGLDLFDTFSGRKIAHWNESTSEQQIKDNRISHLWLEKQKNRLWVFTSKTYFSWIDLTTGETFHPPIINDDANLYPVPSKNTIYEIVKDPLSHNSYWLSTNEGLLKYNDSLHTVKTFFPEKPQLGYVNINRLRGMKIQGSSLWIATRGDEGLLRFDIQNEQFQRIKIGSREATLSSDVVQVNKESLWVASLNDDYAIAELNKNSKEVKYLYSNREQESSLSSNEIHKLFRDRQNNIWIATNQGLNVYYPSHQLFPIRRLIPEINPSNFTRTPLTFQKHRGKLYVGLSNTNALVEYDELTQKQRRIPIGDKLLSKNKYGLIRMASRPNGELWATGQYRIFSLKPGGKELLNVRPPFDPKKNIRSHCLYFLDNDRVFIGTRFNGVYLWYINTNKLEHFTKENYDLVHNRFINEIIEDNAGQIWISTERGISVLDKASLKVKANFGQEMGLKMTYRIAFDGESHVWASSENKGVFGFNIHTLQQNKRITKQQGLPSNAIQHITSEQDGTIWISTQQGLCYYNPKLNDLQIYNTENGLIENHLEGSLNNLGDGKVALGFNEAFTIIESSQIKSTLATAPPRITSITINSQNQFGTPKEEIILDYNEDFIDVEFSALNYTNPENIEYQYKLVGLNEEWRSTSQNRLSFSKLPSGSFELLLRYKLKGTQKWSESTSLPISIKPPFWKTSWFIVLCLAFVALAARFYYQVKIGQIKREEQLKTEMSKELAALEMKAVRSQMNPHFIFNSLNSIKYYVLQNDIALASKYLNNFSKLIRRIFNNSQTEFTLLEEEIETLKIFLELEHLRFGDKLQYKFSVDPALETSFVLIPNMLIQPFIENSVWHGIMHKVEGGTIIVDFNLLENDRLEIIVDDDGIGRANAATKSKASVDHKSKGVLLTQKRIDLINENHGLNLEMNIEDKMNGNEACGTKVKIVMDLKYA